VKDRLLTSLLLVWVCVLPVKALPANNKDALIQIGVEVIEVDEQKVQQLGIQWLNTLHVEEANVPALFKVGTFTRGQLFADLQALITEGAADLLANPKLVARNGTTAAFKAGGELPYAVAGSLGTSTVEFKPYGIDLKIHPQLQNDNQIEMSVQAEISGPDDQNSVSLSGNIVPGIRSRKVSSELTLGAGSTLTMAGLVQSQKAWTRRGVPGLMRIPFLGWFFSHKTQINKRTSIVVFITPILLESATTIPPALERIHG
jgi:pilus assembly protein CpaC